MPLLKGTYCFKEMAEWTSKHGIVIAMSLIFFMWKISFIAHDMNAQFLGPLNMRFGRGGEKENICRGPHSSETICEKIVKFSSFFHDVRYVQVSQRARKKLKDRKIMPRRGMHACKWYQKQIDQAPIMSSNSVYVLKFNYTCDLSSISTASFQILACHRRKLKSQDTVGR